MAKLRVMVVLWVDALAIFAMYTMMEYLTNVWKLRVTHAAAIVNIFLGAVFSLPVFLQFLAASIMGNYWMVLISSFALSIGLGFLSMSTPPVLAHAMGTCSEYRPECIGHGQKILFYIALTLVALGLSGHMASYHSFVAEQSDEDEDDLEEGMSWQPFYNMFGVCVATTVAVIALPYIKPWSIRFGIPAICTLVATLLFLSGSRSYNYFTTPGSHLPTFIRVFVAAASKLSYRIPKNAKELYEIKHPQVYTVPHTITLRCLDRAAIVIRTKSLAEQENSRWRLCRVTDVEETKIIIRMIPVWMTFIFCGVVGPIGLTYFFEPLSHMNQRVGRLKVPTLVLVWFYSLIKDQIAKLYDKIENILGESRGAKFVPSIGIVISMILAILCCITAAKVEDRRLGVVQRHDLVDKPDETVPMTMFWLLPQFILLGAFEGIFHISSISFFSDQVSVLTAEWLQSLLIAVNGIGIFGSILSVYVVGKVSERGGKKNWFQHDLNGSRLDKYYLTLAWLMAINLVVFVVVGIFYKYEESLLKEQQELELSGIEEPYEDNARCCC